MLLNQINNNFQCQEKSIYKQPPPGLDPSEYEKLGIEKYAEFTHTTGFGNTKTEHYNIIVLMPSTINFQEKFHDFLMRDFPTKMAETFNCDDKDQLEYLIILLQNFVCDADIVPERLSNIILADNPRQLRSESISQQFKKESDIYTCPTDIFVTEYENWSLETGFWIFRGIHRIKLDHISYIKTKKENLELKNLLKQENLEPILRFLIKSWIIHQLITQFNENEDKIKAHNFFKDQNVEELIETLQSKIKEAVTALINLPPNERKQAARLNEINNRFSLPPVIYQLLQRISFIKLFVGSATYDIHKNTNLNLGSFQKFYFYFGTYLNFSLSNYLFDMSIKDFAKAKSILNKVAHKKKQLSALAEGILTLLRSVYTILWLPFFAVYFALIGISSIPFSLVRKLFKISFGETLDKTLTVLEAIKDLTIAVFAGFFAYQWISYVGIAIFGSVGMGIGSKFAFFTLVTALSPLLLVCLPEHHSSTFPKWVSYNYGPWVYKKQSSYKDLMDYIGQVSRNTLIKIHAFIGGIFLIGFLAIAFSQLLIYKIRKANSSLPNLDFLNAQKQNINHSNAFKKLISNLSSRLENETSNEEDLQYLSALGACQLAENDKSYLKRYLQEKSNDESIPERNVYRFDLAQIDKPTYLPSWKLIKNLNDDVMLKNDPVLKEVVTNVYKQYTTHFSNYTA